MLDDLKPLQESISLIDVRPETQFNITNTNKSNIISQKLIAINVKVKDLEKEWDQIQNIENLVNAFKGKKTVFVMCRRGNASKEATQFILKLL